MYRYGETRWDWLLPSEGLNLLLILQLAFCIVRMWEGACKQMTTVPVVRMALCSAMLACSYSRAECRCIHSVMRVCDSMILVDARAAVCVRHVCRRVCNRIRYRQRMSGVASAEQQGPLAVQSGTVKTTSWERRWRVRQRALSSVRT